MMFDPDRPIESSKPWRVVHRVIGWGIRPLMIVVAFLVLMGFGFMSITLYPILAPIGTVVLIVYVWKRVTKNR